ncbi:MAG TPA: ATP-binding protein [Solibacterales bacterium]|nr:ATP-binding protein [Bryobacterales bacterium]
MADQDRGVTPSVDTSLASTLDSVDSAEELVLKAAQEAGVDEDELHRVGMAVREAMVNAVVHGNRYSANKTVRLMISVEPDRMTVRITDQGDGFDPVEVPDPLAQENLLRQSGRGILLIRAFVDRFHVRRVEPNGTEVTLVKYLSRPS